MLLHRLLALLLLLLQPLLVLLVVLEQSLLLGAAVPAASLLHTLRALEATVPASITAEQQRQGVKQGPHQQSMSVQTVLGTPSRPHHTEQSCVHAVSWRMLSAAGDTVLNKALSDTRANPLQRVCCNYRRAFLCHSCMLSMGCLRVFSGYCWPAL